MKKFGDGALRSREQYYDMVNLLHHMMPTEMFTYLLDESLASVANAWKESNQEFESVDSTKTLDATGRRKYDDLEKNLVSIKSNIDKMQNYLKENTEEPSTLRKTLFWYLNPTVPLPKDKELKKDEKINRLVRMFNETCFYLEAYEQMCNNLINRIRTESEIEEHRTASNTNLLLMVLAVVTAILGFSSMVTSFFGITDSLQTACNMGLALYLPTIVVIIVCAIAFCVYISGKKGNKK